MSNFNINNFINEDINVFGSSLSPKTLLKYNINNNSDSLKNSLIISHTKNGGSVLLCDSDNNIALVSPVIREDYLNDEYELDAEKLIEDIDSEKYAYLDISDISGINKIYINTDNLNKKISDYDDNISGVNYTIETLNESISNIKTSINNIDNQINTLSGSINHLPASLSTQIYNLQNEITELVNTCSGINIQGINVENLNTIISSFSNTEENIKDLETSVSSLDALVSGMNYLNTYIKTTKENVENVSDAIDILNSTGVNGVIKYKDFENVLESESVKNQLYSYIKESMSGAFFEYVNMTSNINVDDDTVLSPSHILHDKYVKNTDIDIYSKDEEGNYIFNSNIKLIPYNTLTNEVIEGDFYTKQYEFI